MLADIWSLCYVCCYFSLSLRGQYPNHFCSISVFIFKVLLFLLHSLQHLLCNQIFFHVFTFTARFCVLWPPLVLSLFCCKLFVRIFFLIRLSKQTFAKPLIESWTLKTLLYYIHTYLLQYSDGDVKMVMFQSGGGVHRRERGRYLAHVLVGVAAVV